MGEVTHEQANLLLRLYELRREPRLREARAWTVAHFEAHSRDEMTQKYPPGSDADINLRMTISYWDLAASLVNRGLIDSELFFESSGEAWIIWDRIREIVPATRAKFNNPHMYENLERLAKNMEEWRERRAPGSTAALRKVLSRGRAAPVEARTE
jgi:hypothetical protein